MTTVGYVLMVSRLQAILKIVKISNPHVLKRLGSCLIDFKAKGFGRRDKFFHLSKAYQSPHWKSLTSVLRFCSCVVLRSCWCQARIGCGSIAASCCALEESGWLWRLVQSSWQWRERTLCIFSYQDKLSSRCAVLQMRLQHFRQYVFWLGWSHISPDTKERGRHHKASGPVQDEHCLLLVPTSFVVTFLLTREAFECSLQLLN